MPRAIVFHGAGSSPEAVSWLSDPIREFGYEVYAPSYRTLEEALEIASRDRYDLFAGFSLGGAAALISSAFQGGPVISVGAPADRLLQARWLGIHDEGSAQRDLYNELVRILGGPPYENPIAYLRTSVLYYIEKIKGPVLIIHGSEDPIVRPYHALILEDFLKVLGVRVVRVFIEGMRHAPAGHHRRVLREHIHDFLKTLT
ncbi:MAG: prolyl oligopeptidase family serine peptidase [Sulfolobales archaeon]|jgi:pimeloyl-ACP methyl ester carboxylesterase